MHVGDSVASRSRKRQASSLRLESQSPSPSAIVRKCENAPSSVDIDSLSNGDEKTRTRRIKGIQYRGFSDFLAAPPTCCASLIFNLGTLLVVSPSSSSDFCNAKKPFFSCFFHVFFSCFQELCFGAFFFHKNNTIVPIHNTVQCTLYTLLYCLQAIQTYVSLPREFRGSQRR